MDGIVANKRIDAGIKRGPRRKMRQDAREAPRTPEGTFAPKYTPEMRAQIILSVPEAILNGKTTTQIAEEHGMPSATLRAWLIGNETVEAARGAMLAHELAVRTEDIDNADDPLTLARAREGFRAWSWIAERRESRLYGQKQEVTIDNRVTVSHALQEISERRMREINPPSYTEPLQPALPTKEADIAQVIDNKQDAI